MKYKITTFLLCLLSMLNMYAQLDSPPGFVYTEGKQFMLDGRPFYFSGANVYDFFTYGSSSGDIETQFMDKDRIDEHMRRLYLNGIRVIRIWGFSHEDWHGFEPQKGVYSEAQFSLFDYVVKSAEANGLKLIIALENYWNDYGGIKDRLKWEGIDVEGAGTHDQGQFFTNASAVQGYKDYVEYFLTRVNHYDGVEYRNDPTILAWELMNEPRYQGFGDDLTSDTLRAWVDDMGEFIKSLDSNHLLSTGLEAHGTKYGFGGDEGNDFIKIHQSPYIDFASAHPYIRESWSNFTLEETLKLVCQWADESHQILKKPLYIGEFNVEIQERYEWWEEMYGFIEEKKIGASAFWWFPDNNTPRDKFGVFEGDVELAIYKEHAYKMEDMSGGETIYLSLVSPKSGDKYVSGSEVHIEANLINETNAVQKVEFYADGVLLGEDTIAPFELDVDNLPDGEYLITSVATGKNGIIKTSSPRKIQIGGEGILELLYKDASEAVVSNIIKPHFILKNNSSTDVAYEDLSIRYWFDTEDDIALNFFTDYVVLGANKLNGKFVAIDEDSKYLEITFDSSAGLLGSFENSGRMETKIANSNWSDMDQSNDYSFNPTNKDFATSTVVGLYLKGKLISGIEPDGSSNIPPVAILEASIVSGDAPLLIDFDGSSSTDADGDALTYLWDFGNGDTTEEALTTYDFVQPGSYEVTLTVHDGRASATAATTITVNATEVIADFIVDKTQGVAPLTINFDASSSYNPAPGLLTYDWDFGDGTIAEGEQVAHAYMSSGVFIAMLTVTNDEGKSDTKSVDITVTEEPSGELILQYRNGGSNPSDNMINPHIQIINQGSTAVAYNDLSVRYWFTSEENSNLNFWCDWAQFGSGFVNGTFGQQNGMDYLEITFASGAGAIASGQNSGPIQGRFAKANWSNFDETNDYSFNAKLTSYAVHQDITLYQNGNLIFGQEPSQNNGFSSAEQFYLFPNPANKYVNVEQTTGLKDFTVKVIDIYGNVVSDSESNHVDVSLLNSGMYIVEIKDLKTNTKIQKHLVINK